MKTLRILSYGALPVLMMLTVTACEKSITSPSKAPQAPTATFTVTDTPCDIGGTPCTSTWSFTVTDTPTRTFTRTPTPTRTWTPIPPTPLPTGTGSWTPSMGLWVMAIINNTISDYTFGPTSFSVTVVTCLVYLSSDFGPDMTAGVTLNTPSSGSIPVTYMSSADYGSYILSMYATNNTFTFDPNASYSLTVNSTSKGTATASLTAPGNTYITSNGASAGAAYPGIFNTAQVDESAPNPHTSYASPTGVSVGSPFTYPPSAYPDSPGTYITSYTASVTQVVAGTNVGAGSYFVGIELRSKMFDR